MNDNVDIELYNNSYRMLISSTSPMALLLFIKPNPGSNHKTNTTTIQYLTIVIS